MGRSLSWIFILASFSLILVTNQSLGTSYWRDIWRNRHDVTESGVASLVDFEYCPEIPQILTVTGVDLKTAPKSGKEFNLTLVGKAKDSGTIHQALFSLRSGSILLFEDMTPFYISVKSGDSLRYSYGAILPYFIPKGKYLSVISFDDGNGSSSCVQFWVIIDDTAQTTVTPIKLAERPLTS